jgi:hypothetical protein
MPNPPKFHSNSRTPDIIAMILKEIPYAEIARQLKCSKAHVSNVATRHVFGKRKFTVDGLTDAQYLTLRREAERLGITSGEVARSLIIDGLWDIEHDG